MTTPIQLFGGPADGQTLEWRYGAAPRLQVPRIGPDGLTYLNYVRDPGRPHRYLFAGHDVP